jgi:O-antigen ligase
MGRMASSSSPPTGFSDDYAAHAIFAAFLVSLFFLSGGLATVGAVASFVAAWLVIVRQVRRGAHPPLSIDPAVLVFLAAIGVRLSLPPFGDPDAVPGAGAARALLLLGLYGLVLLTCARVPFRHVLWMVVGAAVLSAVLAIIWHVFKMAFVFKDPLAMRLTLLGRASHPIMGAGAIATALVAAVALLAYPAERSRAVSMRLAIAIGVLVFSLLLTGSRGPTLALACALLATPLIMWTGSRTLLVASALGAWALVTATVLLEGPLREVLCREIPAACRESLRYDVWLASAKVIAQHPLWGAGYGFRFEGLVPHAHNAYLGIAMHYGVIMLLLFLWLLARALWKAGAIADRQERFFVVAMLIFANGFMASDLNDPMRFFNTHYLFLWLPLFLALIATKSEPVSPGISASR